MKKILLSIFVLFSIFTLNITNVFAQEAATTSTSWKNMINCSWIWAIWQAEDKFMFWKVWNFALWYVRNVNLDAAKDWEGWNNSSNALCKLYQDKPWAYNSLKQFSNIFWVFVEIWLLFSLLFVLYSKVKSTAKDLNENEQKEAGEEPSFLEILWIIFKADKSELIRNIWFSLFLITAVALFLFLWISSLTLYWA